MATNVVDRRVDSAVASENTGDDTMDTGSTTDGPIPVKDIKTEPDTIVSSSPPLAKSPQQQSEEDSEDDEEVFGILPHHEAMDAFRDGVAELIVGDPLLSDLPTQITVEEVNSQIALEHGQAITVNVRRMDDVVLPVVVVQNGTVQDLKHAIQRHVTLKQIRDGQTTHISWKYIWRRYWLYFNGQKLTEDGKSIRDYGVNNRDQVTFIKRLKQH